MREELKEPLGILLVGDPPEIVESLNKRFQRIKPSMFASVGDVSSKNLLDNDLKPDIAVIDNKVMRIPIKTMTFEGRIKITTRNPPGTITEDAWRSLEKAVMLKSGVAVIVEGEEDLLVLPLILLMPLGSVITYGQPGRGMVLLEVTEERKRWACGFIQRMEEG
jgi:uncharacterized protein (UPF0218 family)